MRVVAFQLPLKIYNKQLNKSKLNICSKLAKLVYSYKKEVLICETEAELLIVFQGTNHPSDWLYNLSTNKVDDIHSGFYQYSKNILAKYDFQGLVQSCNKPIYFVGHSRASCCAIIILFELAMYLQYKECFLILFGSPKPGGRTFRSEFEKKLPNVKTYNFQNLKDIVCQFPPQDEFVHFNSNLYFFDTEYCYHEFLKNHNMDTYIEALQFFEDSK
jgi:predicted lipase